MSSVINKNITQITNQLKNYKHSMLHHEETVRSNIQQYYARLREVVNQCERETIIALNREALNYHQKTAQIIKNFNKIKNDPSQSDIEFANDTLRLKIQHQPAISLQKLETLLKQTCQVGTSNQIETIEIVPALSDSSYLYSEAQSLQAAVLEKIQCERDYYQKRQGQLTQKIRQMQNTLNRKGINIKEMSKSFLQQKCSKLALERLKGQNKILVQKIGQASQQIIRLNSEMGQLQDEIKRLNLMSNDGGRSMVGGSSLKTNSILFESETLKREKVLLQIQQNNTKMRQIQLQQKNQNLLIEITKCMKQIQEKEQYNKQIQQKIQVYQENINQMKLQIESLKQTIQGLNHDYQISLKRKAAFEQQSRQTKLQLSAMNDQMTEQQQIYKNIISEFQLKQNQIIGKVKEIEESKKIQLESMQNKINQIINEKQKLLKFIGDQSNKKGQQLNYKSLLHQEISKLRKQTTMLDRQLQLKQENIYTYKEENLKLTNQLKDLQNKTENNKKQISKVKKLNKEFEKQIYQLNKKIQNEQNLQYKICNLEHSLTLFQSEFSKLKQSYQRKSALHQKILAQMKERFGIQLTGLLSEDGKHKTKKSNQNKMEIIDKYIEEMVIVSSKTAQIKQLKQEIIELKQHKEIKSISKRTKTTSIQQSTKNLQENMVTIGTMIMQQRLKSQKQANDARINELNQILAKEKTMRLLTEQQLQKQRAICIQLRSKQKQENNNEQINKINKQNQQKIQKLQAELKITRANNRKLQNDNNQLQCEVKKKRQLVLGQKRQYKQLQDRLKQKSAELNLNTQELQKLKRLQREVSKKESMFKQFKEKKDQTEEQNISLKSRIQNLQDKIKLLNKQISKKDELLKDQRQIEEKQYKIKELNKLKIANQTIEDQKQIIRKMKYQIQRKDEIIKNTKAKSQAKAAQLEENGLSKEMEIQKYKKVIETIQRKSQQFKSTIKREQNKNYLLSVLIKKIFQLILSQNKQYNTSRITKNRQSTHYYSASSVSPQKLKFSSPASTIKTADLGEGLKILDLRPEDLEGILGETKMLSKTNNNIQHQNSWSMVSPIILKQNETAKQQQLVMGLEELQKLLIQKQISNASVIQLFKRALRVQ